MSLPSGSRLGVYEILEVLGSGGMGEVYRARDSRLNRDVAVKVLPRHLATDPVSRERLRREAVAAAQLDHPFICKVFEVDDLDGRLFVVMELVIGQTLHGRLREGPVGLAEALAWTVEIAEALEAAHDRQIVHRDLKPSNVMVSSQGHVKVMDFGLAKNLSTDHDGETRTVAGDLAGPLTERGARVGTPGYMSPEQIVGELVDPRSDIFSLGVMLCELAGGAHPFRRESIAATTTAILRDEPLMVPVAGAADLPGALRQILQRMLAKLPADRYATMRELRRDLQAMTSGASTTAGAFGPLGGARWASSDRIGQTRRWPMVGRDAERAELQTRLEDAIAGRGSIVMLGGEPGIGKTRLTEAILDGGRSRGCMSLVGHAYEMEGTPPYTPFIEMLEYAARVAPPAALRHALGDSASEVARLMPELRKMFPDVPPPLDVPAEQQRRLLFNGYRDFVERSCRLAPIVCVLEDLHWADDASLQLLMHLAPAVGEWPLLIIGTYRDVELDVNRPFARVLEALLRQRQASRIALRRLPAEGVSALLSAMSGGQEPPASFSRVIFSETEGNPFFVEEVFQHLKEEGRLFDAAGQWRDDLRVDSLEVPEGVRLVIGRRLERLGEAARRVLTTAAVIGRSFSLPLLEAVEGAAAEDAVLDAIEEAERAHLVSPQRVGRETRYLFAHELIRQTLADALSMPRRQRLHGRIAEAIEREYAAALGKHASALAHHLYQAGAAADPEKTSGWLIKAAEESAAAAAAEESLRFVDQAISLWEGESSARMADLMERRGLALRSLGKPDEACVALLAAVGMWDAHVDVDRLVKTTIELNMTYLWQAKSAAAVAAGNGVLTRIAAAPGVQQCPLRMMNALSLLGAGDATAGMALWTQTEAIRKSAGSPVLDQIASGVEPHVRWLIGDVERAGELARRVEQDAEAAGRLWYAADVAWIDAFTQYFLGRPLSEARVQDLRQKAQRIGQHSAAGSLGLLRAYRAMHAGDLVQAEQIAREIVVFNRTVKNQWGFFAPMIAGTLAFVQGRTAQGLADIEEAESAEPPTYWLAQSRRTRIWALAHVAPADALALLAETPLQFPVAGQLNPFGAYTMLGTILPALTLLGRRDDVAPHLAACEGIVKAGVFVVAWMAMAPTLAGLAAGCAREWEASERYFEHALARSASVPSRTEAVNARYWYGDMLIQRGRPGDRDRARVLLGASESLAGAIGMSVPAQQARDLRLSLG